ncbi:efflux transporter outer membrane subunit [Billgrantia pellis]|uniref:Efflux transporter outer membrane subunit n=1 Tax=Billgrantia pellis TaxID=2606936 RepID=A0A7V7G0Q9_9GAMM|nr:efflux transporter outer membrane subunit [Halomonas pellis]KAA0012974.1 efflux transporter outer membrane subunit [Halomonas pellis]
MSLLNNPLRLSLSVLALSITLAGCSLAPSYQTPAAPIPADWGAERVTKPNVAERLHELDWQAFVVDDSLRNLIEQALVNNRNLRQAILNVEASRAVYGVERAARIPGVDLQGSGSRQRLPGDLDMSGTSSVQEEWRAGVGITAFELDFFGRVRNLSESALQEYLATEQAARSVQISLIGELIEVYLARSGAQQKLVLTRQTLEGREESLQLIERMRVGGSTSALDLEDAVGLLEQARADFESADRQFRQASNALRLLVGVSDIDQLLPQKPSQSPYLVQALSPGAPSELIANRPDIHASEYRLRARNADIGVARAAFFPSVSLTGTLGTASADLSNLFESGQRAWSFMPQISVPIFAGGRNRANLDLAQVRKDIAVAEYEQTIQTAFREVADALAAVDTLRREERARRARAESSARSLQLSEARWRTGVDDYLRYLDAQRNDFAYQVDLIEVSTDYQIALARLFRALGGGWTSS